MSKEVAEKARAEAEHKERIERIEDEKIAAEDIIQRALAEQRAQAERATRHAEEAIKRDPEKAAKTHNMAVASKFIPELKVHQEIKDALVELGVDVHTANVVVTSLIHDEIPHVALI